MQNVAFSKSLKYGQIGEGRIANWLRGKGYSVLPVYDVQINSGKGPQLFTPTESLVAPDMQIYREKDVLWVEAKRKTAFAWHRITRSWTTGIDLRHYKDYCKIDTESPFRVYMLFLHGGGQAKDSPPNSPSGLYGNWLSYLREHEHHRHMNWGKSGMVYWGLDALRKIAALKALEIS